MAQDDEDLENSEGQGGHGEEVARDEAVVHEKRAPGRRWTFLAPRHVLCHCGLGDCESQLEKFPMDARRAPQRVFVGHALDQPAKFGIGRWTAGLAPRLPMPLESPAPSAPADDGFRSDHDKCGSPSTPKARKPDPKDSVEATQPGTPLLARKHANLMAQGNVFEHNAGSWGDEEPEKGEELPEREHRRPFGTSVHPERHRLSDGLPAVKGHFRRIDSDHGNPVVSTRTEFFAGTRSSPLSGENRVARRENKDSHHFLDRACPALRHRSPATLPGRGRLSVPFGI